MLNVDGSSTNILLSLFIAWAVVIDRVQVVLIPIWVLRQLTPAVRVPAVAEYWYV